MKKRLVVEHYYDIPRAGTLDGLGFFGYLSKLTEWIYCIEKQDDAMLYINMQGAYNYPGDTFLALFNSFEDEKIKIGKADCPDIRTSNSATEIPEANLNLSYPTDGFKRYRSDYPAAISCSCAFYKNEDFEEYRRRMHPIVTRYLQPNAELQNRINLEKQKLNEKKSSENVYKIGIQVRSLVHYLEERRYSYSEGQYIDGLKNDIDNIMKSHDRNNTRIYLATLLSSLTKRITDQYDVVIPKIQRDDDPISSNFNYNYCNLRTTQDAAIDGWCLAECDEAWGGVSNVLLFASLLNPTMKVRLLPYLENFNSA